MLKKTLLVVLLFAITAVAQQTAPTGTHPIDNAHSNVGFSVPILGGLSQVKGKFTDFAITLNHDEKDITKSSVSVVIKATSIDTGIERRDAHLRNADFFDVEKFPEITFKSERIEKKGKQFIAHGPLTMHGVTKQIALPFTVTGTFKNPTNNKMSMGYSAKVVLNRRDFGINYSRQDNPTFLGDEITVEIELVTRALDAKAGS
ncbi:MAG TPA: YceI family protein [Pyrinomonadaceae bacterium]|nr:YceI family protein [Pyrinomonadaceae bacterium]